MPSLCVLGKMKSALALFDSYAEFLAEHIHVAIIWHLEVVDAGHDGGEVVIRCVWWLAGLADDSEHGCERLEA